MEISVGSQIKVTKPTKAVKDFCQKELVVRNPEYSRRVALGLYLRDTPADFKMYKIVGDTWYLPFGVLDSLYRIIGDCTMHYERDQIENAYLYNGEVTLYPYQKKAVRKMVMFSDYGLLEAPTGSGKTRMGMAMIQALGGRTLWITHTKDLLRQAKSTAIELFGHKEHMGTISSGDVSIGHAITFATIQTLSKLPPSSYKDYFDVVIVDECHRVSGSPSNLTMYFSVLNEITAQHKYGLSATMSRADGTFKCTTSLLGSIIHTVDIEETGETVVPVTLKEVKTKIGYSPEDFNYDGTLNYVNYITNLTLNKKRNEVIAKTMRSNSKMSNLILSDRNEHLQILYDLLTPSQQKKAVILWSKCKDSERQQIINDMRDGKYNYMFATYSLAKEGLDIPRLDRLYMATPKKDKGTIIQTIGRVRRKFDGKDEAICYDFVDDTKKSIKDFKLRKNIYIKNGCRIS